MMYLVTGSTGEYSDRNDWSFKVFASKANAETFCKLLNDWCKERRCHVHNMDKSVPGSERQQTCEYDPGFNCDYTGTEYLFEEVEEG